MTSIHKAANNVATIMAAGSGTRMAPLTWRRSKAVLPLVGTPAIQRINVELLARQGFDNQTVTTWYMQNQIQSLIKQINQREKNFKVDHFSLGEGSGDLIGNAGGVYLAYRNKFFPLQSIRAIMNLPDMPRLKELGQFWLNKPKADAAENLFNPAVEEVRKIKPYENLPLSVVVGCDCLAKVDLQKARNHFLEMRGQKEVLANLTLMPFIREEDVLNYGLVVVDGDMITQFVEKPIQSKKKYKEEDEFLNWLKTYQCPLPKGSTKLTHAWLVNEQVYDIDPAVLAIIETYMEVAGNGTKNENFPDMSMHVLKLLASAGKLTYRITDKYAAGEYWNDVGDALTYLEATTGHILSTGLGGFEIPGEKTEGSGGEVTYVGKGATFEGNHIVMGSAYIGGHIGGNTRITNSVIEEGANVEDGEINTSLVLNGTTIAPGWHIKNCILGPDLHLQKPSFYGFTDLKKVPTLQNQIAVSAGENTVLVTRIPGTIPGEDRNQKPSIPLPLGII